MRCGTAASAWDPTATVRPSPVWADRPAHWQGQPNVRSATPTAPKQEQVRTCSTVRSTCTGALRCTRGLVRLRLCKAQSGHRLRQTRRAVSRVCRTCSKSGSRHMSPDKRGRRRRSSRWGLFGSREPTLSVLNGDPTATPTSRVSVSGVSSLEGCPGRQERRLST